MNRRKYGTLTDSRDTRAVIRGSQRDAIVVEWEGGVNAVRRRWISIAGTDRIACMWESLCRTHDWTNHSATVRRCVGRERYSWSWRGAASHMTDKEDPVLSLIAGLGQRAVFASCG